MFDSPTPDSFYSIRFLTEVNYPEDGPLFDKWDYFSIPKEKLPERFLSIKKDTIILHNTLVPEMYDWLNEEGYWVEGWQGIGPEQEKWLEENDHFAGSQTETTLQAEFI